TSRGTLTINNSTISSNTVDDSNTRESVGGGILVYGGSLDLRNSAVESNTAHNVFAQGGGIAAVGATHVTIDSSSVSLNTANGATSGASGPSYGGGGWGSGGGPPLLKEKTVFGNTGVGPRGEVYIRGGCYRFSSPPPLVV